NGRTGHALSTSKPALSAFRGIARSPSTRILPRLRSHDAEELSPRPASWINTVLEEWDNPTFCQPEMPVPRTTFGTSDLLNFGSNPTELISHHSLAPGTEIGLMPHLTKFNSKLTRKALKDAKVVAQVDNKFVLVRMFLEGNGDKGL